MRNIVIAALVGAVAVSGCSSTGSADGKRSMNNTEKGAIIGAVGGAVLGAAVADKKGKGALIGAVGGGLAGAAVGKYMDRQKQDLEKNLAAERKSGAVTVEKQAGDVMKITMTSQTAFDTGSAEIKPGFRSTMDRLADVVVRYQKTAITVVGHTDAEGSSESNRDLSQRRAQAVVDYLGSKNVNAARLTAVGRGETEPVADNKTEAGRRANRRVELLVAPVRAD
jgi:outer membrane protein OmpA-like peptidoglycan-associated protein